MGAAECEQTGAAQPKEAQRPLLPLQKAIACSTAGEHRGGTAGAADHEKTGATRQKEVRRPLLPLQKIIVCSAGEHGGGTAGAGEHEQTGASRQKAAACSAVGASESEHTGAAWYCCRCNGQQEAAGRRCCGSLVLKLTLNLHALLNKLASPPRLRIKIHMALACGVDEAQEA